MNESTFINNKSKHSFIIMTSGLGKNVYKVLQTNDSLIIKKPIKSFKLYSGETPQIIKYIKYTNDTLIGFRFKDWNYSNQDLFKNTYIINSNMNINTITITDNNSKLNTKNQIDVKLN